MGSVDVLIRTVFAPVDELGWRPGMPSRWNNTTGPAGSSAPRRKSAAKSVAAMNWETVVVDGGAAVKMPRED